MFRETLPFMNVCQSVGPIGQKRGLKRVREAMGGKGALLWGGGRDSSIRNSHSSCKPLSQLGAQVACHFRGTWRTHKAEDRDCLAPLRHCAIGGQPTDSQAPCLTIRLVPLTWEVLMVKHLHTWTALTGGKERQKKMKKRRRWRNPRQNSDMGYSIKK